MKLSTLHNRFYHKVAKRLGGDYAFRLLTKADVRFLKEFALRLGAEATAESLDFINEKVQKLSWELLQTYSWIKKLGVFRKGSELWLVVFEKYAPEDTEERFEDLEKIRKQCATFIEEFEK